MKNYEMKIDQQMKVEKWKSNWKKYMSDLRLIAENVLWING